jgi:DNA-binding response OmpR family regulator
MDKGKRLLVVEDEDILRHLLVMTLRGEGYEVFEADNGKKGLRLALKHHPQMILLDIVMPTMNGTDMLSLLRQDKWGKKANVILLTNLGDFESMDRVKHLGVTDYLVKSDWSLDELTEQIAAKI